MSVGEWEKKIRGEWEARGVQTEEKERERKKEEKSTESNVAEKGTQRAQAWNKREREREKQRDREKQEGNFAYLLYPEISVFNPYAAMQEAKSHN